MDLPDTLMSSAEEEDKQTADAVERMDISDDAGETEPSKECNNAKAGAASDDDEGMPDLVGKDEEKKADKKELGDDASTSSTDDEDTGVANTQDADELLLQATQLKEEGNAHFGKGELDAAARSYRRGAHKLKKLNRNNTGDEQVKALLISLHNNLSMVCFKTKKYRTSVDVATQALEIDPANVKALYRRAVAQRQTGDLEAARADLRHALQLDPKNAAVQKELITVKKQLQDAKETQKKALSKAFEGGGSFLYNDKEAEQKRKQEEQRRKKEQEQELYKKRKADWEDECVSRMAKNEPAITFEDWEKEQKEKEEKIRKEEEKKRKEEEKKRREEEDRRKAEERKARKAAAAATVKQDDDSDDDDGILTEKELAAMKGYKITADGKKTSYFTRELSEEEKKAIGDTAPKRLDAPSSSMAPAPALSLKSSTEGPSRPSAWNKAGTWEEKDTTTWCTKQLRMRLEATSTTNSTGTLDADVCTVHELTGDASVAIAGGKKRYIFDYHAKLGYEIKANDDDKVVASGTVRLPDICSTSHEELEVTFEAYKQAPSQDIQDDALAARQALAEELRANVQQWLNDFNETY